MKYGDTIKKMYINKQKEFEKKFFFFQNKKYNNEILLNKDSMKYKNKFINISTLYICK